MFHLFICFNDDYAKIMNLFLFYSQSYCSSNSSNCVQTQLKTVIAQIPLTFPTLINRRDARGFTQLTVRRTERRQRGMAPRSPVRWRARGPAGERTDPGRVTRGSTNWSCLWRGCVHEVQG